MGAATNLSEEDLTLSLRQSVGVLSCPGDEITPSQELRHQDTLQGRLVDPHQLGDESGLDEILQELRLGHHLLHLLDHVLGGHVVLGLLVSGISDQLLQHSRPSLVSLGYVNTPESAGAHHSDVLIFLFVFLHRSGHCQVCRHDSYPGPHCRLNPLDNLGICQGRKERERLVFLLGDRPTWDYVGKC